MRGAVLRVADELDDREILFMGDHEAGNHGGDGFSQSNSVKNFRLEVITGSKRGASGMSHRCESQQQGGGITQPVWHAKNVKRARNDGEMRVRIDANCMDTEDDLRRKRNLDSERYFRPCPLAIEIE
jgi:hypothetical protein